jgi:hypothetical protein
MLSSKRVLQARKVEQGETCAKSCLICTSYAGLRVRDVLLLQKRAAE